MKKIILMIVMVIIMGGCSSITKRVEKNVSQEVDKWDTAMIQKEDGLTIKKVKGDDKFYYKVKDGEWKEISKQKAVEYIINVTIK